MAGGKVFQDEDVGEEVGYLCVDEDVAEDGEDLVSVQHPLFLLESVSLVEGLNFVANGFGASDNGLHLADG